MFARKTLAQSKISPSACNKASSVEPQFEPDQQVDASEHPSVPSTATPQNFAFIPAHASNRKRMAHQSLPLSVHRSLSSPGTRLDPDVRVDMERRFRTCLLYTSPSPRDS